MGLAIVGGVATIIFEIDEYRIKRNPVIVSPAKLPIHAGAFDTRTSFDVHNRSDETIYTAWVKISMENPSFENIRILITSDDGRKFVKPEGGEFFNSDILLMPVIDKNKLPAFFLIFRSLSPKETMHFKLKVESAPNFKEDQSVTFRLSVIGYKREDYWFGVQGDTAAFKFQVPEGFSWIRGSWPFLMLETKHVDR